MLTVDEQDMISNKAFALTTNLNTRDTMSSLHESCPKMDFSFDEEVVHIFGLISTCISS
jgi:hypothetical protein